MKKTLIAGATPNEGRYAFFAAEMLMQYGHEFVPVGIKKGIVLGKEIQPLALTPFVAGIDTVTLYVGPQHQSAWQSLILTTKPKRIIFNPGTENPEFQKQLEQAGIEVLEACTLVMLRTGQY